MNANELTQVISLGAGLNSAKNLRKLFEGTYLTGRWEVCGWVRRQQRQGPPVVSHVVIPRPSPHDEPFGNAVWHRAADLLAAQQLEPVMLTLGASTPEPETVALEVQLGAVVHQLIRTTREAWGTRVAECTGPASFHRMLLWRLKAAGTLTVHKGLVSVINRANSHATEMLEPLAVYTEADFFRLARTVYKRPDLRFEQPGDGTGSSPEFKRGMQREWYPPGVRVYVSPQQPGLWDTGKPVDPRYQSRDERPRRIP